jgi:hypothetical protein
MLGGQAFDQNFDHEGFGAHLRQALPEGQDEEIVEAHGFELAHLDAQRRQPEGRLTGLEELARMGLEGQHCRRRAELACLGLGSGDDRLMTAMDAVKIAQRHDGMARFDRDLGMMTE